MNGVSVDFHCRYLNNISDCQDMVDFEHWSCLPQDLTYWTGQLGGLWQNLACPYFFSADFHSWLIVWPKNLSVLTLCAIIPLHCPVHLVQRGSVSINCNPVLKIMEEGVQIFFELLVELLQAIVSTLRTRVRVLMCFVLMCLNKNVKMKFLTLSCLYQLIILMSICESKQWSIFHASSHKKQWH